MAPSNEETQNGNSAPISNSATQTQEPPMSTEENALEAQENANPAEIEENGTQANNELDLRNTDDEEDFEEICGDGENEETGEDDSTKKRISLASRLSDMKRLFDAGLNREQVCKEMQIPLSQFYKLYFLLNQQDEQGYQVDFNTDARKVWIEENGFRVSRNMLMNMKLHKLFEKDKLAIFEPRDGGIFVSMREPTEEEQKKREVSKKRKNINKQAK